MLKSGRGRRIMVSLVLVLFLLGATGCGAPAENEVDEGEIGAAVEPEEEPSVATVEEKDLTIHLGEWQNPVGLASLIDMFEELEWTWAHVEDGVSDSMAVNYRYAGTESVDGVTTNLAILTIDGQEMKVWVDEKGEAVQAEVDGEILPAAAPMMLEATLATVFWPFFIIDYVREGLEEPGSEWNVISTIRQQFGDIGADVTRLELALGPPFTEGEKIAVVWGVADFDGDFQMLVEWHVSDDVDGDFAFTMQVEKVVPH